MHRKKQDDYSFPKGHVEDGEYLIEAAERELKEETGYEPMILGRLKDLEYKDSKGNDVVLRMYLGCVSTEDVPAEILPETNDRPVWVSLEEIEGTLSYENLKEYYQKFVKPLFTSPKKDTVKVEIVFSKQDPYLIGIEALSFDLDKIKPEIRYENIEIDSVRKPGQKECSIIYFVGNSFLFSQAAYWLEKTDGSHVINLDQILHREPKSVTQSILGDHGIPIPPLTPWVKDDAAEDLLLKSNYHGEHADETDPKIWRQYLEEDLAKKGWKELKIACIGGHVFREDGVLPSEALSRDCRRIMHILKMAVFSADVFFSNNESIYQFIDINCAPVFYKNKEARKYFAEYLKALAEVINTIS